MQKEKGRLYVLFNTHQRIKKINQRDSEKVYVVC